MDGRQLTAGTRPTAVRAPLNSPRSMPTTCRREAREWAGRQGGQQAVVQLHARARKGTNRRRRRGRRRRHPRCWAQRHAHCARMALPCIWRAAWGAGAGLVSPARRSGRLQAGAPGCSLAAPQLCTRSGDRAAGPTVHVVARRCTLPDRSHLLCHHPQAAAPARRGRPECRACVQGGRLAAAAHRLAAQAAVLLEALLHVDGLQAKSKNGWSGPRRGEMGDGRPCLETTGTPLSVRAARMATPRPGRPRAL